MTICVKSFERFCPEGLHLNYIIIENSDDISYKHDIINLVKNNTIRQYINNPTSEIGSNANAVAIEMGLRFVDDYIVFLCHSDICILSPYFYQRTMEKLELGYELVGNFEDDKRIKAIHVCGLMVKTEIAKSSEIFPLLKNGVQVMDVGDGITDYCRKHNRKYCCFRNTWNDKESVNSINQTILRRSNMAVSMDDQGNPLVAHLSRGSNKTNNSRIYGGKSTKIMVPMWKDICERAMSI